MHATNTGCIVIYFSYITLVIDRDWNHLNFNPIGESYICILTTPLIMTCELSCWLAYGSNSRILVKSWKRDFAWQLDVYGV
ncbi:hypothetical protein T4D_7811 [Trichinella pseudospiralis]|uniref:Uncharacterized protein n=1 Tax=Trichinella pseudospiralis TaxID=6337 RepID=A0A0V1G4Q2_TRIPS|nr:hypothetical protein T4D_7811 [Trichinella pseudospiralis]